MYTNRIPGYPPMCLVPVSPRVIMFAFKLSFCRICSLNCSRFAPEWTFKCEGNASLLGWHMRRWNCTVCISKDYVISTWTYSPVSSLRWGCWLFRTTQVAQKQRNDRTAGTAHSCSRPRRARSRAHLGKAGQTFTYWNDIYCVESTLIASVMADIFDRD